MKKKLVITALLVLALLIIKSVFFGTKPVVVDTTPAKTPKIIQTEIVGKSAFLEQIHVTGRVAAAREVMVSTQGT